MSLFDTLAIYNVIQKHSKNINSKFLYLYFANRSKIYKENIMDKTYTLEELAQLPDGTKIICNSIPFTLTSFFLHMKMGSPDNM